MHFVTDKFSEILNHLRQLEGDELVSEFIRIFKSRVPNDVNDLIRFKEKRDFDEIRRKAHFLSTTLLTLKFNQGFAISTELEEAAKIGQEASVMILTDRLVDYLNCALKEIE